jgi:hypothetical protein
MITLIFMPSVSAAPQTQPFPDVPFKVFSTFIEDIFGPKISLATVLLVLFSMIENPELLSLHARQQHPSEGENKTPASGWIRSLSRAVMHRLKDDTESLFKVGEFLPKQNHQVSVLSTKLDKFTTFLNLTPYDQSGKFKHKLLPPSYAAIQAVHVICPSSSICIDTRCPRRALLQNTKPRDVPLVTLIKDNLPYVDVPVLSGKCVNCGTIYYADHERFKDNNGLWNTCYLNSARFLKIGQNIWIDRKLSHSILSGMYNFHASASAFMQFWNDCNSITNSTTQITRRQIWHAFVQESIRAISSAQNTQLELREDLTIHQVITEAFAKLGNKGIIGPGKKHSCSECSQPHKHTADFMANEDPAAVIGVDENSAVPVLTGQYANLSARETAAMRAVARTRANNIRNNQMNVDDTNTDNVKMVVLDGVVIAPTVNNINYLSKKLILTYTFKHCAHVECTKDLKNARGGAFCDEHEISYGNKCRMVECARPRTHDSLACQVHQREWRKYKLDHSRSSLAGVRRMLQRPGERNPWQPGLRRIEQPHDDDDDVEIPRVHYFGPAKFYCVETICAPCGVVIAWTKFDKSESPTRILKFLGSVYPTEESRPAYICIDKACRVLWTAVVNKSWNSWKKTSRFIVDSYHYINHRTTDFLCRKWCNPGPLDGSAPNLIKVAYDKNGQPYLQRAFNTQVCIYLC